MATFPSGNPGEFPLDPATQVGQFRLIYGDTESEPYTPVEPGYQNYTELADAEIEAFLAQGGDSITRSIGYLYLAMAGKAAKESITIKDHDLSVDLTKRADSLRAMAQFWFDNADNDDLISAEEAFDIVPTGNRCGDVIPELTIPIYGRKYTVGRVC